MKYSDFAILSLIGRLREKSMRNSTPKKIAGELFEASEVIEQLMAERQTWITVTPETMPDRDALVEAYFPAMKGTDGEIQIQKGWSIKKSFVSHWRPLPKPPEGENNGNTHTEP